MAIEGVPGEVCHISGDTPDFEQMFQAMQKDNLILMEGAFCHYNARRDGGLTIYSILSYGGGKGDIILEKLKALKPKWIRAVCPQDLGSNAWYEKRFSLIQVKESKTGRKLNVWQINLE